MIVKIKLNSKIIPLTLSLYSPLSINTVVKLKKMVEKDSLANKKLKLHCGNVIENKEEYMEVIPLI